MSDRVRVSRREPAKGKEASPAEVAFSLLGAVYPEAPRQDHSGSFGIFETRF